jgi:hydrogenase large subunit
MIDVPARSSKARVDPALVVEMARNNQASSSVSDPLARIGGTLAFYCAVDLRERRVSDAAAMATRFRGYEALLLRRSLREAGLVSSTASGICGGVHATASGLCLEMALGIAPPPLSIVVRNLLSACQFLSDNPMHLFVLSGPDYSAATVRRTNPEIWASAQRARARHVEVHGHATVAALITELERPTGRLVLEALTMVRVAREAYAVLAGSSPRSESFVPGGVALALGPDQLDGFERKLSPFVDYAKRCIAVWEDVFDFLYAADPRYQHVGECPATLVDFGQWDDEDHYDARYQSCDAWGERRWSTPGAIVDGNLVTTKLSELNCGLEELVDRSYCDRSDDVAGESPIQADPLGNPIGARHPWNRKISPDLAKIGPELPYSWASATTWRRRVFEVGAYARVYVSALGRKLPVNRFVESTGRSLVLQLPAGELPAMRAEWVAPERWNAFERIRARAHSIAFSLLVITESCGRARDLLRRGERRLATPFEIPTSGRLLGAGFGGAGRGFLAHWAVINAGVLANYRILTPSRINAGPRTPWGEPGACEQAMMNTPIVESNFSSADDYQGYDGIDIVRAVQSFDPCTASSAHLLVNGQARRRDRVITADGS